MRICTVVGARPQFVKAAVVSRALANAAADGATITEKIVHTGQHYDSEMSQVFFDELDLPGPAVNLGVGSASHATQTASMMTGLASWLASREPFDWMLVYGDTNSTLAAAMVASKLGLPLAHVEAGLRSFVMSMPEELNRVVTDRLSDLLLCPTPTSVHNLKQAGVDGRIVETGDVMYDATMLFHAPAEHAVLPESVRDLHPQGYAIATVHRAENTDDEGRFLEITEALSRFQSPVVLVAHPRVRSLLERCKTCDALQIIPPVGYLQMMRLVASARVVLTDSGGLQKEAYWLGTPCVTLRNETEWIETLTNGWNQLAGADPDRIVAMASKLPGTGASRPAFGVPGRGTASSNVVRALMEF